MSGKNNKKAIAAMQHRAAVQGLVDSFDKAQQIADAGERFMALVDIRKQADALKGQFDGGPSPSIFQVVRGAATLVLVTALAPVFFAPAAGIAITTVTGVVAIGDAMWSASGCSRRRSEAKKEHEAPCIALSEKAGQALAQLAEGQTQALLCSPKLPDIVAAMPSLSAKFLAAALPHVKAAIAPTPSGGFKKLTV